MGLKRISSWTPVSERLLQRVDQTDRTACWEWPGAADKKNGYGKINGGPGENMLYTHRVSASWFWFNHSGDCIPTECSSLFGYEFPEPVKTSIHHECRNHNCVNPDHLYWVSQFANSRLGDFNPNAEKTGCPHGHGPYTGVYPNGWRYCKKCKAAKEQRRRVRLKSEGKTVLKGNFEAQKTHCSRGHEYSEANTRYTREGHRKCKLCVQINNDARKTR